MNRVLRRLMLLIGVIIGSVSIAAAQDPWTSVGSAGTVDEADLALFVTSSAQVSILTGAALPASVLIRYNVVAFDQAPGGIARMTVRFRDTGTGARVLAVLRGISFTTGETVTLLRLDGNTFAPSPDFQTQAIFECFNGGVLDFTDNAYYIEATLTKTSATANPAVQLLKVESIICNG